MPCPPPEPMPGAATLARVSRRRRYPTLALPYALPAVLARVVCRVCGGWCRFRANVPHSPADLARPPIRAVAQGTLPPLGARKLRTLPALSKNFPLRPRGPARLTGPIEQGVPAPLHEHSFQDPILRDHADRTGAGVGVELKSIHVSLLPTRRRSHTSTVHRGLGTDRSNRTIPLVSSRVRPLLPFQGVGGVRRGRSHLPWGRRPFAEVRVVAMAELGWTVW